MPGKLLILSTRFYPHPAVGAVRMSEWSRLLPRYGWSVVVASPNHGVTVSPETLKRALHRDVDLRYVNQRRETSSRGDGPQKARRRTLGQRLGSSWFSSLIVPDFAALFWISKRRVVEALIKEVRPDIILSSSPPHSVHGAARWLSRRLRIPWVADFRDPYMTDPRYRPRQAGRALSLLHHRYERKIYDDAALVIHAIPSHARWAAVRYPKARILALTNGCPPELLAGSIDPVRSAPRRISVRIVGSGGAIEIRNIVLAVRGMVDSGEDAELRIVGSAPPNSEELSGILGSRLVLTGPKLHAEALREIVGADVLIAPLSVQRAKVQGLSSKLFEYAGASCPVILINPTSADEDLARELPGIAVLQAPEPETIRKALVTALTMRAETLQSRREYVGRYYSRDLQVKKLAAALDSIVEKAVSHHAATHSLRSRA